MTPIQDHSIEVLGMRTHYLEAGEGFPLVLLHSGEFGACAELSWEFNIGPLAEHFRVLAPDWLGFGQSEKVFNFEGMQGLRIRHIAAFLDEVGVESAHFIGNSMGGGQLARAAVMNPPGLAIDRMVLASGGGVAPHNDARKTLNSYDGSRDHMRRIVETLIRRPDLRTDDAYIDRRHRMSHQPGAWEATAAARFSMPGREPPPRAPTHFEDIVHPTLIIAGGADPLRIPGYGETLQNQIAGSELVVFEDAGHCPQIDLPEQFNNTVIEFLLR